MYVRLWFGQRVMCTVTLAFTHNIQHVMLYVINTHFYYASVTVHTTHTRTDQTNHNQTLPSAEHIRGKTCNRVSSPRRGHI